MAAERGFDVIVAGGGTAGCVAAARLSEDPGRRVLLLEAGPDPLPIPDIISNSERQISLLLQADYALMYPARRSIDGSEFYLLAGRVMGGGSSVNVMAAPRPTRYDLDGWTAAGNPGWSYDDCLPVLKRIESDQDFPDDPIHGDAGPLYIKRPFLLGEAASEPVQAFIDRAVGMGLPLCPDLNCANPYGVCASPYNIKNGVRQSVNVAYLADARGRPNLDIVAGAAVSCVDVARGRARSVVYQKDGFQQTATADRVVLTAGAFHSPQILMLSGVGPAGELEPLGIRVTQALEGVGGNYQDHATVTMTFEGKTSFRPDWVVPRFRLMYKSRPDLPCGDFHIMMRPPILMEGLPPAMPVSLHLLEQHTRGRVSLASAEPADLPLVESRMLEDPRDIEAMAKAMDFVRELTQDPSMGDFYSRQMLPEEGEDRARFARSTHDSYHHASGTCMMGPASNPMAVVDSTLRVHGIDNLYVADASIMPDVTHANTNLTCIMIGERVADFIRGEG
jgi:choline dehydrogenase